MNPNSQLQHTLHFGSTPLEIPKQFFSIYLIRNILQMYFFGSPLKTNCPENNFSVCWANQSNIFCVSHPFSHLFLSTISSAFKTITDDGDECYSNFRAISQIRVAKAQNSSCFPSLGGLCRVVKCLL